VSPRSRFLSQLATPADPSIFGRYQQPTLEASRRHNIPGHNALALRRGDLAPQCRYLCAVEARAIDCAEHSAEVGRRDRRNIRGDIGESRPEQRDRGVIEIIPEALVLDLVKRGVAGSDDSDSTWSDACAVIRGQVASVTQGLQTLDNVGPGCFARSLDVNKEIECLRRVAVEDSIVGFGQD
jgi:hypothetical protein